MAISVKLSVRTYARPSGIQYFQYTVSSPARIWAHLNVARGTPVTLTVGDHTVPLFDVTEDSLAGWAGSKKDPNPGLCQALSQVGVLGRWVGFECEGEVVEGTTHQSGGSGLTAAPVDSPL